MSKPALVRRLLVSALCLVLSQAGCVSRQLGPTVVSYNLAVEQAQNEVLLLNAIRAENHLPMYLTDISKITGSIRRDLTATVAVPFGHLLHAGRPMGSDAASATANGTATPGATYSVNPTFDVSVLNTQDFMRGFLQPIKTETFAYYWDQDYPQELLLHLFVLRVEVKPKGSKMLKVYNNHPHVPPYVDPRPAPQGKPPLGVNNDLQCFSEWVTWFVEKQSARTVMAETPTPVGPSLDSSKVGLTDLITVTTKDGLTLAGPPFQLISKKKDYQLKSKPSKPFAPTAACTPTEVEAPSAEPVANALQGLAEIDDSHTEEITFHLRSPEGVIYHLGQLLRLLHATGLAPSIHLVGEPDLRPIFVALQKHPAADAWNANLECDSIVDVTDAQKHGYIVPWKKSAVAPADAKSSATGPGSTPTSSKVAQETQAPKDYLAKLTTCSPGMSRTTLNIVSQLIGLQKAAKDFLTTSVVRTIGGQ